MFSKGKVAVFTVLSQGSIHVETTTCASRLFANSKNANANNIFFIFLVQQYYPKEQCDLRKNLFFREH